MEIDIANERFVAHGLMILARNYLDVYPYEKWSDKVRELNCLVYDSEKVNCVHACLFPLGLLTVSKVEGSYDVSPFKRVPFKSSCNSA